MIRALVDGMNTGARCPERFPGRGDVREDALLMPPGSRGYSERATSGPPSPPSGPQGLADFVPGTIKIEGDLAVEEGAGLVDAGPHGIVNDHGNLLVTWQRTDTSWEVTQDIWNSTLSSPETTK